MLPWPMAPTLLALLALWVVVGAMPLPDICEQEVNKIQDLLQVSCVGKGLRGLPVGLPPDTGILLLSSNCLAHVSLAAFEDLHNLTNLDLANNSLAALKPGSPLPSLEQLILSHNALRSLPPLPGLPRLRGLALGHNAIAQLPTGGFRALQTLQDLELQGNQLRHLPPGAFEGLAELKDLDLSDNLLEALPQALLASLAALKFLRLERNRLPVVPEGFFQTHSYAYVYLDGNPWHCDCALQYLRDWLEENEFIVYTRVQGAAQETTEPDPESVTCETPLPQKGRPVMYFQAACGKLGDSEGEEGGSEDPGNATPVLAATSTLPPSTGPPPQPPSMTPGPPSTPQPTRAMVSTRTPSLPPSTPAATPPGPSTASPPVTAQPSLPPSTGDGRLLPNATTLPPGRLSPASHRPPWGLPTPPSWCLCPELPVRVRQVPTRQPAPVLWAGWPATHCCVLRLALSAACLALLALPALMGGCCLGWGHLGRPLPPMQGAATASRGQPGASRGVEVLAGPRRYYVCKEFQVAPFGHVTWLLISLPGPAGRGSCKCAPPGSPSACSLGCGQGTSGGKS